MFICSDSCKSGLMKGFSCSEDLSAYKMLWSHIDEHKFCIHLCSLKIPPLPCLKGLLNKIIIQILLIGMCTIFHCTKLKCSGQSVNFKFHTPSMFVFFRKNDLIKSSCSSENLSEYRILCSIVDWCKFCIHLRSLNVHHIGMVAATALETMASR
jgi:hypothetical protein